MKFPLLLLSVLLFSIRIQAQDCYIARNLANKLGLPVICNDSGYICGKCIVFEDTLLQLSFDGFVTFELYATNTFRIDSIAIAYVIRRDSLDVFELESDYQPVYDRLLDYACETMLQNVIVYPDAGDESKPRGRHLMTNRVRIKLGPLEGDKLFHAKPTTGSGGHVP